MNCLIKNRRRVDIAAGYLHEIIKRQVTTDNFLNSHAVRQAEFTQSRVKYVFSQSASR